MNRFEYNMMVLALGFLACLPFSSHADYLTSNTPYIGAEVQYRHAPHKVGMGDIYNHKAIVQHFFTGFKVGENLAFEAGLHTGRTFEKQDIGGKVKHQGHHYTVMGLIPVDERFEFFGGVGPAFMKHKYSHDLPTPDSKKVRKAGYRLVAGLQAKIDETFSFRASAVWQNTCHMGAVNNTSTSADAPMIRVKDTLGFGVGVLYGFN